MSEHPKLQQSKDKKGKFKNTNLKLQVGSEKQTSKKWILLEMDFYNSEIWIMKWMHAAQHQTQF